MIIFVIIITMFFDYIFPKETEYTFCHYYYGVDLNTFYKGWCDSDSMQVPCPANPYEKYNCFIMMWGSILYWSIFFLPILTRLIQLFLRENEYIKIKKPKLKTVPCDQIKDDNCIICLEALNKYDVGEFNCKHQIHLPCFEEYKNYDIKCPLCTSDLYN